MPLATAPIIIGTLAFFIREGQAITLPSAGSASATLKPGKTEPTWIGLGAITSSEDSTESDEKTAFAPSPGHLEQTAAHRIKFRRKLSFKTNEFGPLALELSTRSAALTSASTTFTPFAQVQKRGWLKVERYDQADNIVFTEFLWGTLEFDGALTYSPEEITESSFVFNVLKNALNGGTIQS